MKEPRCRAGRDLDRYGTILANQIDLAYLKEALTRDDVNMHEAIGLGWALWGVTYAKARRLQPDDRATLERLIIAIDQYQLDLKPPIIQKARELLDRAFDGDLNARERMLSWARREGI